jgi:hypothetical protein
MDVGPGVRLQVLQSLLSQLEKDAGDSASIICTIEDLQLLGPLLGGPDDGSLDTKQSAADGLLQRVIALIDKSNVGSSFVLTLILLWGGWGWSISITGATK